jgi:aminoacrylate hydrolase
MSILQVPGGQLQYEIAGKGPPLLLIHGTGVCGSGWEPQVKDLVKDFTCLWFDNRGIGGSTFDGRRISIEEMALDAKALMNSAGWDSAHVVGHSMGGLIAEQLALEEPRRVRSLALWCTFAKGPEAARITPRVAWMGIRSRVGTPAMRRRAFLEMLFPQGFLESQDECALAQRTGRTIGRDLADSPPIMMKQLAAMRAYDRSARLAELARIPTLVVSAESDPIALPAYGRGLAGRIPGSRYVEIAGASHGLMLQLPERVNELLRGHFAGRSDSQ